MPSTHRWTCVTFAAWCQRLETCHIVLAVGSGSKYWPVSSPSISLRLNPSADFVFGCRTPSLSVNIFPTPLILDAICNSSSRLSYLCGASQACPMAALLSVYHNGTSVRNKLGSADPPSCCLFLPASPSFSAQRRAVNLLQFCPRRLMVVPLLMPRSVMPHHMCVRSNESLHQLKFYILEEPGGQTTSRCIWDLEILSKNKPNVWNVCFTRWR